MVRSKIAPALAFLAATALSAPANAQGMRQAPLGSYPEVMTTLKALGDATDTRNRADIYGRSGSFFQEVQEYDAFIGRWQNTEMKTDAVWSALAAANVE